MVIGPAWTRGEIEKPAGERDKGSWTALYYTDEQQSRLGVDEHGAARSGGASQSASGGPSSDSPAARACGPPPGLLGAVGPAWTRGLGEVPAGEQEMGTWTAAVFTEEQQARLGVNESGEALVGAPGAAAAAKGTAD